MCGRYKLAGDWQDFPFLTPADFEPNGDVRPTHRMPVVRIDDQGKPAVEMRRWGFLRTWPGVRGKMVKKQLFNAVGEELTVKRSFKKAFETSRCLVPMSAWFEWPVIDGKKTKIEIGLKQRRTFAVAGLFETSKHPDTKEAVDTFTIVTVPPNEILGSVHDRAPLVRRLEDHDAWLEGGILAHALIGAHPDSSAFYVRPA